MSDETTLPSRRHTRTRCVAMPVLVATVHYGIAFTLVVLAVVYSGWIGTGQVALGLSWLPLLCLLACAGLLRRVVWGRFLVSCISVLATLLVACAILPKLDTPPAADFLLARLPVGVAIMVVVATSTLMLLPALIIGWRRHWFRQAWW